MTTFNARPRFEAHTGAGVAVALDRTYKAVADFTSDGDQYDDQTLVLLRQEGDD